MFWYMTCGITMERVPMPRITKPLSATEVRNAKPRETEWTLSDGNGLELCVFPNGNKLWRFRYTRPNGSRTRISLGAYPEISLSDARDQVDAYRRLLAKGKDPQDQKVEERLAANLTFRVVAEEWRALHQRRVTAEYAKDLWNSLERHVLPGLGHIPIQQVTAQHAIAALRPLKLEEKHESVRRSCQRINEVMTYAVNSGYIIANPCAGIRQVFDKPTKQHLPSIEPSQLPVLLHAVNQASITVITRNLIMWSLHTLARPGEAATVRWDEIDWDAKVWRIPAEKMKRRREHQVPLTDQALGILHAMKPISGRFPYVFPGERNRRSHCNKSTVNMALKRMGFAHKLVAHGFRSLGSTVLNERGFAKDLIEVALSHMDRDAVRAAYNRTDFLERRRPMMEWWSSHIQSMARRAAELEMEEPIQDIDADITELVN
ncbi:integrase domain-containing protein [Aeromonas jandaei]|uniref:integrase domain-containing protein n=1 Tax=Aeromonas jandaei TaxID=650 RepID=UPI003D19F8CF